MSSIVILGIFVADTAYRAERIPRLGETILGKSFNLSPGGKGSNQAVAAAKAGANAHMITRLGTDTFADMAIDVWQKAGVTPAITQHDNSYTGAACIFIEAETGNNAIIVTPGVAGEIDNSDIDRNADLIANADIFITQLEQPLEVAMYGLELARKKGVRTLLNPAPAADLPDGMLALCDFVTPNETEAEGLTGIKVTSVASATDAAQALRASGAGAAIITLGENGALYHDADTTIHMPAMSSGKVIETTGAGDSFNGSFAAALAEGMTPVDAVKFGCAAAGISVTRAGAANSMPSRAEIDARLAQG
ncbi:ribokinase [Candidatus Puniceispirillum marinum]|uniref:Ribokinase n=1 Tax=Puniceispirillum marinum (strain IMCC1322) TaxID=488538 RepID=D5BN99_PUNMI|nr:ribokinase [Candidatus Puniceispirillum marinum]ADE40292.1 PfkB [Candidatus Puniceispirillum marinum IMCC1322]